MRLFAERMRRCVLPALLLVRRLAELPTALAFTSPQASSFSLRSVCVGGSRLGASPSYSTDVVSSSEQTSTATTFTSPSFRVYIEDTDAYGVMYNGNYLRSYERALSHVERDDGDDSAHGAPSSGRWIMSQVTNQKFRSSPALGEEYVIRGELMSSDDGESGEVDAEVWELEMVTKKDDGEGGWVVHNSATATLTRARTEKGDAEPIAARAVQSAVNSGDAMEMGMMVEHSFVPYHDEFDFPTNDRPHIPIRSALNYFERSRSSHLGGPEALRRMQEEDDLLWVVTGIDDGELFLGSDVALECLDESLLGEVSADGEVGKDDEEGGISSALDWHPAPGREVTVQTNFVAKRRGMMIDCRHSLFLDVRHPDGKGSSDRRLIARATVTIMALRGSTRRPTSKLPGWVLERLMVE